tara:strand:+ start:831 stop:1025 length:195 start_codon:yes stop_codon:yes gene_type:complete
MKRLIPFIAFACFTGFTATSGLPVIASGCINDMNKITEVKCAEDDIECQTEKAKKYGLYKPFSS